MVRMLVPADSSVGPEWSQISSRFRNEPVERE
jgi:hypothetical protein